MGTIFGILFTLWLITSIIKWANKGKKEHTEVAVEEEIPKTVENNKVKKQEKELVKRFKFPVVGLDYENRRNVVKRIINQHKKAGAFYFDKYDGLTNKEIIEDYFTERVYELSGDVSECVLEKEDDNPYDPNAIKVMLKDIDGEFHHIGYVPREYCEEIRDLMNKHSILIGNSVTGGKYKQVDYDDYGDEKVKVFNSDYGLYLSVSFWNK